MTAPSAPPPPAAPGVNRIDKLLRIVVDKKASDLHIEVGSPPIVRIDGDLERLKWRTITEEEYESLMVPIAPEKPLKDWRQSGDTDFAYAMGQIARFRVNMFRQEHGSGANLRMIPPRVIGIEELGLPPLVAHVGRIPRGLVLVTGPTGSGKSTTLAALIDWINRTRSCHIVTIEDPVEFIHTPVKSLISHRELGFDTPTFAGALKAALREDPDVVLIGELRDLETIEAALVISETGHLAFATLHTNSAVQTINRILDVFPPYQQPQVRAQLSFVLEGVVVQQLLPRSDSAGRVLACDSRLSLIPRRWLNRGFGEGASSPRQSPRRAGSAGCDLSRAPCE